MSTDKTWQTESISSDATEQLGEQLGRKLKGGEVIELVSDVGGGKTTFVRGLVRGTGSKDHVASPTFTISRVYHAPAFTIHHFDFYRLTEPGLIAHELAEVRDDPQAVVVIEWATIVQDVLPVQRLTVRLQHSSEAQRHITFNYPASLEYIFL